MYIEREAAAAGIRGNPAQVGVGARPRFGCRCPSLRRRKRDPSCLQASMGLKMCVPAVRTRAAFLHPRQQVSPPVHPVVAARRGRKLHCSLMLFLQKYISGSLPKFRGIICSFFSLLLSTVYMLCIFRNKPLADM